MKLLEYQAKELMQAAGLPVPPGWVVATSTEAVAAAQSLGGGSVVVKAQVPTGGRGKAGGVKLAADAATVAQVATDILALHIGGYPVQQLLVTPAAQIAQEFYISFVLDRSKGQTLLILSAAGGMEIEEVAAKEPGKLITIPLDPFLGLRPYIVQKAAFAAGLPVSVLKQLQSVAMAAYQLYQHSDAVLLEINPLALTEQGNLLVLDAKMEIDDSAIYRHPELAKWQESTGAHPLEQMARAAGLAYVKLNGNVGVIGNGAGLVMTTLDMIQQSGGKPANFLDIGGGAREEVVRKALSVILADSDVRSILINVFGGITRCDEVAKGLLAVAAETDLRVPVVVRLAGTQAEEGWKLLADSSWETAASLLEAAEKAVAAAARGER